MVNYSSQDLDLRKGRQEFPRLRIALFERLRERVNDEAEIVRLIDEVLVLNTSSFCDNDQVRISDPSVLLCLSKGRWQTKSNIARSSYMFIRFETGKTGLMNKHRFLLKRSRASSGLLSVDI